MLARLGDVLTWLETSRMWSRERALTHLLDRMPDSVMDCLYWISLDRDPVPVNPVHQFGFPTPRQRDQAMSQGAPGLGSVEWLSEFQVKAQRRMISHGIDNQGRSVQRPRSPVTLRPAVEPGMPALRLLLGCWRQSQIRIKGEQVSTTDIQGRQWMANYLAVPLNKAFEWWDYGQQAAKPEADEDASATAHQGAQSQAVTPHPEPAPVVDLTEDQRRRLKGLTEADKANLEKLRGELTRPPGQKGRGKNWSPWQRVTANYLQEKIGMDTLAVILGRDVNTLAQTLDADNVRRATATLNRQSGGISLAAQTKRRR